MLSLRSDKNTKMMFTIRKKFLFLVFVTAFVGIGIYYIYELPNEADSHPLIHGENTDIPNRKSHPNEDDSHHAFYRKSSNEIWKSKLQQKKEISENAHHAHEPKKKIQDTKHTAQSDGQRRNIEIVQTPEKDNPIENDAADYAGTDGTNQTFWEWLNLVKTQNNYEDGASRSVNYCRPVEQIAEGSEGKTVSGFTLEHVHVVLRHGDRSPIYSLPRYGSGIVDCYMNYSKLPDDKTYRDYLMYMQTVWEVLGPETHGARFGLFPRNKRCEGAQLTPKGVHQHLENGRYLRKVYVEKLRLFGRDDIYSKMIVRTTDYTRTYQSALAFAYGFIHDFDYFKLKIKFSKLGNFCSRQLTQLRCDCKGLNKLSGIIEEEYANRSRSSRIHNEIKRELADIFEVETARLPWIAAALDVIMGQFCHGKPLPCARSNKRCISPDLVNRMWKFVDFHGRASQWSYANLKFSRLIMQPLLYEIYSRMNNVTRGTERTKFYLFSGHDTTIAQLRTSLGISDGIWPPYASRVVFELYSGKQEKEKFYFMRVLFNGKDLTRKLIFCRHKPTPHGLCPLDYFKNFVQHENLKAYGSTEYSTVCQV